jgi:2-keto-3-deoxy-galactonokinase
VRTAGLFGEIEGADLPDYLSGMLIGAEFADAGLKHSGPLQIIASDALSERYRDAAAEMGMAAEIVPSDAIVGGYLAVAEMGGLLPRSRGL